MVWSLRHLPDELRTAGTLLALDHIWRHIDQPFQPTATSADPSANSRPQDARVRRLVVVDEASLLMCDGKRARFLFRMAKAARKRGAGLTVVTQNVGDLLSTDLGQAVVANAATQILLRQAPQAIDAVGHAFGLTAGEKRLLLAARHGQGLLIAGTQRTGFEAVASQAEHQLASTGLDLDVFHDES